MRLKTLLVFLLLTSAACKKETVTELTIIEGFEATPAAKSLTPGILDEASGIADSKANPGYLWTHEDGGTPNDIALLSHDAGFLKKISIKSRF